MNSYKYFPIIIILILNFTLLSFKTYSTDSNSNKIDLIKNGEELYKKRCANCHGPDGKGKSNGFFLSPNLTIFKKGYASYLNILQNGYGRMPAYGGRSELTILQLDELVSYLKNISTNEANWK